MTENIDIKLIEENTGQIKGLSKNPRKINQLQLEKLKHSIKESPEMLAYRTLLVYPHNGKYVIICGNMRYKACKLLDYSEMPCYVLPEDTTVEKLKEYAIKDNIEYGKWDFDFIKADQEWLDFFSGSEFASDILPKHLVDEDDAKEIEDKEEKPKEGFDLEYSIALETREEYDKFVEYIIDLQNKYPEISTISGRIIQSIQDYYEFITK